MAERLTRAIADGKTPVETVTIKELIPHIDSTYQSWNGR